MLEKVKSFYHFAKNIWAKYRLKAKYKAQDRATVLTIRQAPIEEIWIDNNRGGGADLFMRRELNDKSRIIIRRAGYVLGNDDFYTVVHGANHCLINRDELNELFAQVNSNIHINTLVDYSDLLGMLRNLSDYKRCHRNCKISYYVHDYFCICPSINLMCNEVFCGMKCASKRCNLRYKDRIVDICEWRQMWGTFLKEVDEVVCFSESSKKYISLIYGELNKLEVKPHDMSYFHVKGIPDNTHAEVSIAVVGRITTPFKGKDVVRTLIRRYVDKCRLVIIGTSRTKLGSFNRRVKHYPEYSPNDLGRILAQEKISHVIFPSLCPETFSYVVSELIMLEIPVWGFDIGAQGEKLRSYKKGRVFQNEKEMYDALDALIFSKKR